MSMKQLLSELGQLNLADPLEDCICFFSSLPAVTGDGLCLLFCHEAREKVSLQSWAHGRLSRGQ